jgi:hypothetical protein
MRTLSLCTLLASLLSCTGDDKGSTDSGGDTAAPQDTDGSDDTVHATMMVLDPMDGTGIEGVTVESPTGLTERTDGQGTTRFDLEPRGTFQFALKQNGAIDHLVFGPTGTEDFTYRAFLATENMLAMVGGLLGTSQENGTGILVVIIDYDDLEAVVGANASIGSAHGESWVMTDAEPTFGNTVPEGGNGVVVFPNIAPGETSVTVTPPDGVACTAFPGGSQMPNPPIFMNHATVVTFHCRD